MRETFAPASHRALTLAVALYLLWALVTYLLEGQEAALQRPEATGARLAYAVVANILIGTCASVLAIRLLSSWGVVSPARSGFRGLRHAVAAVVVGVFLGVVIYTVQGAPSLDPIVILNAYAQVLVVSVAEVLVCWAVLGSVVEFLLRDRGRWISVILASIISSTLFGAYHFGHSPPFNTVGFVILLTIVGLLTSAFFFVSRDVYGTIAFHNFLGIFGVISALGASGGLATFERPVIPLLVMAVLAVVVLVTMHLRLLNHQPIHTPPGVR